jgi:hypothetical protein
MTHFMRTHPKRERGHKDKRHHGKRSRAKQARQRVNQSKPSQNFSGGELQTLVINPPPARFIDDLTYRVAEAHFHRINFLTADDLATLVKSSVNEMRGLPQKVKTSEGGELVPAVQIQFRDQRAPTIITVPQIQQAVHALLA